MSEEHSENFKRESSASSQETWRNWKWWLPYLGGIVGLCVFIGTLLTFTISLSRDMYRWLTWTDNVDIITFSSMAPQAFLNSGDGEIFLSHIDVRGELLAQVINLNTIIKPHEFLTLATTERTLNDLGGKKILATNTEQEWNAIKETKLRGFADPSYVPVIYYANSPELQLYKEQLRERLRTFKAEATFVYYTSKGRKVSKPVAVEGVVLH